MTPGRIAIIGAGPSGAIALDSFLKAGYSDITVFERNKVVGGTWNLDEHLGFQETDPIPGIDRSGKIDPPIPIPEEVLTSNGQVIKLKHQDTGTRFSGSSLYPQVETNVIAELMQFSNRPFPPIHPDKTFERFGTEDAFRNHDVVRDYVVDLFAGREQYVRLNTSVEKAWQPDGLGSKWKIILRHQTSEDDEWYTEVFDFIYVAIGRFSVPNVPNLKGLREASHKLPKGSILHTKTFRDPANYKGKNILVVGAGFSNVDIVQLVKNAGSELPVHLSLQSLLPVTIPGFAQPWIVAHPPIETIAVDEHDKIDVTFTDGQTLKSIDTLILGTGYRYSYPFLEEYVGQFDGGITSENGRRTKNLFWSTWWKYDASLAISADITDSVFWRFVESQSKACAGLWKRKRSEWPTLKESEEWEAARNAKGLKDFHTWWPHFDVLFTGLARWGNYDPGDVNSYLPLFEKGFRLKDAYWTSLAEKWLKDHPQDRKNYEKTLAFLESRKITQIGL